MDLQNIHWAQQNMNTTSFSSTSPHAGDVIMVLVGGCLCELYHVRLQGACGAGLSDCLLAYSISIDL